MRHNVMSGSPDTEWTRIMMTSTSLMRSTFAFWTLMAETQVVMTLRILGMAGVIPVRADENARMVSEKGPAFARAIMAGSAAALRGASPDRVAMAAMRPLGRKTRANVKRLTKSSIGGSIR
jgi:hypothetical protein